MTAAAAPASRSRKVRPARVVLHTFLIIVALGWLAEQDLAPGRLLVIDFSPADGGFLFRS